MKKVVFFILFIPLLLLSVNGFSQNRNLFNPAPYFNINVLLPSMPPCSYALITVTNQDFNVNTASCSPEAAHADLFDDGGPNPFAIYYGYTNVLTTFNVQVEPYTGTVHVRVVCYSFSGCVLARNGGSTTGTFDKDHPASITINGQWIFQ